MKYYMPLLSKKIKDIPTTGHGAKYSYEMSRPQHFLDNWLRNGSMVICLIC